jgi:hypothetical protein
MKIPKCLTIRKDQLKGNREEVERAWDEICIALEKAEQATKFGKSDTLFYVVAAGLTALGYPVDQN